ncbi:MAG: hypothetical protein ABI390_02010 [Daejeonella sp.]
MLFPNFKILFLSFFLFSCQATLPQYSGPKINGVNFVAPVKQTDDVWTSHLKTNNIDWVSLIPYAFSRENEPGVFYNSGKQWWGESTEGIKLNIAQAKSKGIKVMLKPQVWMRNSWIGDYDLKTEAEWQRWEADYSNYILTFARIADSMNVEAFCVGTEYRTAVEIRPDYWKKLIVDVRQVYKGKLTYCANWDDYQKIDFWSDLDFIGLSGYFPLSESKTPGVESLNKSWQPIKSELKSFSEKYKKPILFIEIGYRNIDQSAWRSWETEQQQQTLNPEAQKNAYEAFFQTFWNENWVAGAFIWKWYEYHDKIIAAENDDWTPQNKPAQQVLKKYYGSN